MILQFATNNFELTSELEKYAYAKVMKLARTVPRRLRIDARCDVAFSQVHKKGEEFNTCKIVFTLDDTRLVVEETTLHMYSSLDVTVVRVAKQLKEYVAKQGGRGIRGVLHTYVHRPAR